MRLPYTKHVRGASLDMITDAFGIEWMVDAGAATLRTGTKA
jgi:uncharacterized glyoxalase superfamily protein PhnB